MHNELALQTGTILGRWVVPGEDDVIVAIVRLPAPVWDDLTASIARAYRDWREDLPLEQRIGLFLQLEASQWQALAEHEAGLYIDRDPDDDDVLF